MAGVTEHRRTNRAWELMRVRFEQSLSVPMKDVRRALQALDDAAVTALGRLEADAVGTG